jgi:hypothetical protein
MRDKVIVIRPHGSTSKLPNKREQLALSLLLIDSGNEMIPRGRDVSGNVQAAADQLRHGGLLHH